MKYLINRKEIKLVKGEPTIIAIDDQVLAENILVELELGDSLHNKHISIRVEDSEGQSFFCEDQFLLYKKRMVFEPISRGNIVFKWNPKRIIIKTNEVESGFLALSLRLIELV